MPVESRVDIDGLDKLEAALKALPRTLQRKVLKKPLRESMPMLRATIAGVAPVLDTKKRGSKWMYKTGARKKGLVARNVKVLDSTLQRRRGNVGVWLTVTRPRTSAAMLAATGKVDMSVKRSARDAGWRANLKQAKALAVNAKRKGAFTLLKGRQKNGRGATYYPNDPFYFKFLEQGTKYIPKERYQFIGRIGAGPMGDNTLRIAVRNSVDAIEKLRAEDK